MKFIYGETETDVLHELEEDETVEFYSDSEDLLLYCSPSEAMVLADKPYLEFERGREYFNEVYSSLDAWDKAEETYVCDNNATDIERYLEQLVGDTVPEHLKNFIDYEKMWDQQYRFDYIDSGDYVFHNV